MYRSISGALEMSHSPPYGSTSIEPAEGWITVRLTSIRYAADGINLYEFTRLDEASLPPASPGAHIDIALPGGLIRQYSLIETADAPSHYVVCVKRDPNSRGGSRYIHGEMTVGQTLRISRPRNNFALDEAAAHSVLVAGGIGITPLFAMMDRLRALGRKYELHYACRTRREAIFRAELEADGHVALHFDDEVGSVLNIGAILERAPAESHFYCCGPTPMLETFEAAARALSVAPDRVHTEYFSARHEAAAGGFVVELARSGRSIDIPAGETILDTLREAGIDVPSACEQGLCGACETHVIRGTPDHRDSILSEDERAAGETMMICCSGSKSDRLVLDL